MPVAKAKQLADMATCAALYAVAIAVTAFVPTPWGVGQFRPAVVIPVIYALLGGPLVAGGELRYLRGDLEENWGKEQRGLSFFDRLCRPDE